MPCCETCGHLRSAERFHTTPGVPFAGGAWGCLVSLEDHSPADQRWSKGRFDVVCTCPDCWAHLEREEGLIKKLREHGFARFLLLLLTWLHRGVRTVLLSIHLKSNVREYGSFCPAAAS